MLSFKQFLLNEALVTFGNQSYPKFGNIVILAGGAGSGKGFVTDKMLGIEGKIFDVDAVKGLVLGSKGIANRVKRDLGYDVKNLKLKNPEHVKLLHAIVADELGLIKSRERVFIQSVLTAPADRKPNIIFDVTLKDLKKLHKILDMTDMMGYQRGNVHIVWVANEMSMAVAQNKGRSRVVPEEILVATHKGASATVNQLISQLSTSLGSLGDFHIVFNKFKVDALIKKGTSKEADRFGTGRKTKLAPMVVDKLNFITVKKKGSNKINLTRESLAKIKSYVPNPEAWADTKATKNRSRLKDFTATNDLRRKFEKGRDAKRK